MHFTRLTIRKQMNSLCIGCSGRRNKDAVKKSFSEYIRKEQNVRQDSFILILLRVEEKDHLLQGECRLNNTLGAFPNVMVKSSQKQGVL